MNEPLRDAARRVRASVPGWRADRSLSGRSLRRRVAELEREIQECRRLNRRLAELTDVVQELLVPIAQRDEAKVREYLDRYAASL